MSSTATQVDLYNMALARIGHTAALATIGDSTTEADLCNLFWPMARDTVLQARAWGFATRRSDLSAIAKDSPDLHGEWEYRYRVPAEALQVIAVLPPTDGSAVSLAKDPSPGADFIIEENGSGDRDLYTNQEEAILHYVERVADVTLYSPQFVQAVVAVLAHHLAPAIVKGAKGEAVAQRMLAAAESWTQIAAGNDAAQSQDMANAPFNHTPSHIAHR